MAKAVKSAGNDNGNHICLMTLRHNGVVYPPGSFVELTEEQAESLVASKAVRPREITKAKEE